MWPSMNETLTGLCSSTFWDSNLTWNTPHPEFTICFEKTILTWLPCAFLWICLPFEIYQLHSSRAPCLIFHLYNISKQILISMLIITSLFDIAIYVVMKERLPAVDIYTPLIKLSTFCLMFYLTLANIRHGVRSSGILFIFSLLLVLSGAPQFRTELRPPDRWKIVAHNDVSVKRYSYLIYYCIVVLVFVLNCFADTAPAKRYQSLEKDIHCPWKESSFLSRIFFSWCGRLVRKGYNYTFSEQDLWDLDHEMRAATNAEKFHLKWNSLREKHQNKQVEYKDGVSDEIQRLLVHKTLKDSSASEVSIIRPLIQVYGAYIALGFGARVLGNLMGIASPLILNLILTFIEYKEEFVWHGYLYMSLLLVALFLRLLLFHYFLHVVNRAGYQIQTALMTAIYKKALRISNGARKHYFIGEIVNLMAVDVHKLSPFLADLGFFLAFVVDISLGVYFLWNILGPCILAGVAVMIANIALNCAIISRIKKLQHEQMKYKDKRMRLTNEILFGIRALKLDAYEPSFERQVTRVRNEEIALLKSASYYNIAASTLSTLTSVLVAFVTFGLYVLSSKDNILNPRTAFVSLSFFNILKYSVDLFPKASKTIIQGAVALIRIGKFLNAEEMRGNAVTHKQARKLSQIK